jgi:ubiquinone/menaquinone biosynthesis C-methylase UbiE
MDIKSLSQERFSRFADSYVTSDAHAKGKELDRLVEIARPQPDWLVLDLATGGGHTALRFASRVARVVATDISPGMIRAARAFVAEQGAANIAFGLVDAQRLPFRDGIFDLVTCRIAPHHFEDGRGFVHEGARVLKAGGLLLIQDPLAPEDEGAARYVNAIERLRDPSHNRAFSKSEWMGFFQAAGLQVEAVDQIIKRHAFVPWAERQRCSPGVVARLVEMAEAADDSVREWLEPQHWGTPEAEFVNPHIIIAGRRGRRGGAVDERDR